ncbi:MAG: hypothetical protein K2F89_09000, partial [Treponemataceae bacterium]|nr:hypothetical protein [Treponemataceae bacterium]
HRAFSSVPWARSDFDGGDVSGVGNKDEKRGRELGASFAKCLAKRILRNQSYKIGLDIVNGKYDDISQAIRAYEKVI